MNRKSYLILISIFLLLTFLTGCLGGLSAEDKEGISKKINLWVEGIKDKDDSKVYSAMIPQGAIKSKIEYKDGSSLGNSFDNRDVYISNITSSITWLYTKAEQFEIKNIVISSGDNTVTVIADFNSKSVFINRDIIINLLEQDGYDVSLLRNDKSLQVVTMDSGKIVFKLLKIDDEWYINEFSLLDYTINYGYDK
jgi:hypothetical protein